MLKEIVVTQRRILQATLFLGGLILGSIFEFLGLLAGIGILWYALEVFLDKLGGPPSPPPAPAT